MKYFYSIFLISCISCSPTSWKSMDELYTLPIEFYNDKCYCLIETDPLEVLIDADKDSLYFPIALNEIDIQSKYKIEKTKDTGVQYISAINPNWDLAVIGATEERKYELDDFRDLTKNSLFSNQKISVRQSTRKTYINKQYLLYKISDEKAYVSQNLENVKWFRYKSKPIPIVTDLNNFNLYNLYSVARKDINHLKYFKSIESICPHELNKGTLEDIQNGLIEKGFLKPRSIFKLDNELIIAIRNYQIANNYLPGVYTSEMIQSLRTK